MGYGHRKGMIDKKEQIYIDTHGHYCNWQFNKNREEILKDMKKDGCQMIVECGCSLKMLDRVYDFANTHSNVVASLGFFPHDVRDLYKHGVRERYLSMLDNENVVMIGECGFDFSRPGCSAKEQEKEFRWQIELGIEKKLPICIHSRDAEEDTMRVLRDYKKENLVLYIHSYSYGYDTAMELNEMGVYFGCGGMLTYKRNDFLRYALRDIDESKIVFETDAPYLPPENLRGTINTALNIPKIANVLAGVREEDPITLMKKATNNSLRLIRNEK